MHDCVCGHRAGLGKTGACSNKAVSANSVWNSIREDCRWLTASRLDAIVFACYVTPLGQQSSGKGTMQMRVRPRCQKQTAKNRLLRFSSLFRGYSAKSYCRKGIYTYVYMCKCANCSVSAIGGACEWAYSRPDERVQGVSIDELRTAQQGGKCR